eukprot:TRINITY_DN9402_c0_g1_i2.p1 TRINITY_DN9402_c0_g1~~TRINITY_DN9402_c0_g1_i2.p1  ORF type:complete len:382 (+),score=90.29 TRINITY_DN9402_c0_g1_i2:59-1204(+)
MEFTLSNLVTSSFSDYIIDIVYSSEDEKLILSTNTEIKIYNPNGLNCKGKLKTGNKHMKEIQQLHLSKFHSDPEILLSCSIDGVICSWNLRTNKLLNVYETFDSPKVEIFSCACNDRYVIGGCKDGKIVIWDINDCNVINVFTDCHALDVCYLKFHPNEPNRLYSCSDDGLMCGFDLNPDNVSVEDEALAQIFQMENSVQDFYFIDNNKICCITHQGTIFIWDIELEELIYDFGDIRTENVLQYNDDVNITEYDIGYIIKVAFNDLSDSLYLFTGNNLGHIQIHEIFPPDDQENNNNQNSTYSLKTLQVLPNHHSTIIRQICCNFPNDILYSICEGGKIASWSSNNNNNNDQQPAHFQPFSKNQLRANHPKHIKNIKFNPY